MKRILLTGLALALAIGQAHTQNFSSDLPTTVVPVKITTGSTLQLILAGQTFTVDQSVKSLTIENNNTTATENCWIIYGQNVTSQITAGTTTLSSNLTLNGPNGAVTVTVQQAAILIAGGGGSVGRYFPYLPSDPIYGTCLSNGDSMHLEYQ